MSAAIDLDPSLALAYLLRGNVRLQSGDCGGAEDLVCAAALSPALGELLGGNLALERMRQVFDHGSGAHRNMQAWARRWNAGNRPGDRIQALEGLVRNFARQGNRSAALRHLARLVDMDWAGWDRLEADPSLKSLWSDPEYVEMQRRYYARQTQAVAQARERLGDLLRRMDTMPRMEESPGQWQEFLQEFGDAVEDIRVRVAGMEEADSVWMRLQNRAGNWWATVETGRQMRMRQSAESAPGDTIAAYVRALVASSIEQYAALGGWVGADDPGPQVAGEIRDALMAWRDAAAGTASAERLEAAARSLGREWQDLAQLLGAEASILRGQSAFALDDGIPEARVVRLHAGLDALARGRLEDARNQLSALERSAPGWYGTELLGAALDQETGRPDDAVSRRLRRGVEMACGNPAARALAARIAGRLTSGLFDLRSLPQDRFDLALDLLASGAVRESIFIEFSAGDEPVVTFTAAGSSFADVAYWNVRGLLRLLSGRDPSGGRMDLERFLRTTESGPATDRVRAALGDLVEVRRPFLARTAAEMGAHAWSLIHRSREDAAEVAEYLEPWAAQLRAMPDGHERAEWLREVWFAVAGGRARSGDTPKALRALSLLVETGWNDWGRFEQESAFDSVRHHPRVGPLRRRSGDY
jgi:tetratricopeptide (TPR) repeat protein